jgi:hypothetical protein
VTGSLLDDIGCGCSDELWPVEVGLDDAVMAELSGSGGGVAITLSLPMSSVELDTSKLPLGLDDVALGDVDVIVAWNGEHRVINLAGRVTGNASVWASSVPLRADAPLDGVAILVDDALVSLQVQGRVSLDGGELWCGLTPLRSIAMADAQVTLNESGLWLHATAQASVHPGFSITGDALVDGRFTRDTWSITVCADVMSEIISASVKIGQCIDMTAGGAVMCDCHRDDAGHCDGSSGDEGDGQDEEPGNDPPGDT